MLARRAIVGSDRRRSIKQLAASLIGLPSTRKLTHPLGDIVGKLLSTFLDLLCLAPMQSVRA